jgi:hypothetical protein
VVEVVLQVLPKLEVQVVEVVTNPLPVVVELVIHLQQILLKVMLVEMWEASKVVEVVELQQREEMELLLQRELVVMEHQIILQEQQQHTLVVEVVMLKVELLEQVELVVELLELLLDLLLVMLVQIQVVVQVVLIMMLVAILVEMVVQVS